MPGREHFRATQAGHWLRHFPGCLDTSRRGLGALTGDACLCDGGGGARPAARPLQALGVACIIAESISSLFFRNCVNFGLMALNCPGISTAVDEGDTVEISIERWTVRCTLTGHTCALTKLPEALLQLIRSGGVYPMLESNGIITPARLA